MKALVRRSVSLVLISAFPAFAALRRGRQFFRWLAVVLYVGGSVSAFSQGSLTPPGAPAALFKTLNEIEPRINIQRATNPLPNDANYEYIINAAGSYYLTANLVVTKSSGIHITAPGVTLDLNGFQIVRNAAGNDAITVEIGADRCTIKNGTITNFVHAVYCPPDGTGIKARSGFLWQVAATACNFGLGEGWRVESCSVHNANGGIYSGYGSVIHNCTVTRSSGYCISGDHGSVISNCTVSNATSGPGGIIVSFGSIINCAAYNNSTAGIVVGNGSAVTGCVATFNTGDGISATQNCLISGNLCQSNTSNGIETSSNNNRIDSNQCMLNTGHGIKSSSATADFIVRNTCYGNAGANVAGSDSNYSPNTGNYFGPLGLPGTSTSPWANF